MPALCFPDPVGPLPDDARACFVAYENIKAWRRQVGRRAVARRPLDGLDGPWRNPVRAVMGLGSPGPPVLPHSDADNPVASARFGRSPTALGGSGGLAVGIRFRYGEVDFSVPQSWLQRKESGGDWTPRQDVLDDLWSAWRASIAASGTDWGDLMAVLGCFDVDTDADNLFWDAGWGGPLAIILNALQMSANFDASEEIVDFRIHFLAEDARFEGDEEAGQDCTRGSDGEEGGCGIPYDWISVTTYAGRQNDVLVAYGCRTGPSCAPADYIGSYEDERNGAPKTGCEFGAKGGANHIRMQPSHLYWGGILNDYLMYWARVAYDYWLETGDASYRSAAQSLALHTLTQILYWAGHLCHEFGHVYCGGNHCVSNGLFMESARQNMVCKVRALLGLYAESVDLSPSTSGKDACWLSGEIANYTDSYGTSWLGAALADAFCGAANVSVDATTGEVTCTASAEQRCRIGDGTSFTHGTAYDVATTSFCRTPCGYSRADVRAAYGDWRGKCTSVEFTGVEWDTDAYAEGVIHFWSTCAP
jgi:hypothetical protein